MPVEFILITLAVVAAVAAGGLIWWTRRRQTAFIIDIREGQPHVTYGEPPEGFVIDVQRIGDFSGLRSGRIRGMHGHKSVRLEFRGIPKDQQWQFRNAWRHPI